MVIVMLLLGSREPNSSQKQEVKGQDLSNFSMPFVVCFLGNIFNTNSIFVLSMDYVIQSTFN